MKKYLFIISLCIFKTTFSQIPSQPKIQPARGNNQQYLPYDTLFQKDPLDPSAEYLVVRNQKGIIVSRGNLVNSKKNGVWREYSNGGVLMKMDEYKMGIRNGASLLLPVNGTVTEDLNYKNDSVDGQKTVFQRNGLILSIENFSNGLLNGEKKTFYENGSRMEESFYKNNLRDGKCKWYMQNGNPFVEYHYVNGLLNGPAKEYDTNGRLKQEGNFKNNNEEGEWKEYNDSVLVKKIIFKDGKKIKEIIIKK